MARTFQAYGLRYNLQAECALEPEDFRKLSTLAKLERQAEQTRITISDGAVDISGVIQLVRALEQQERRIKRLREELKEAVAVKRARKLLSLTKRQ